MTWLAAPPLAESAQLYVRSRLTTAFESVAMVT